MRKRFGCAVHTCQARRECSYDAYPGAYIGIAAAGAASPRRVAGVRDLGRRRERQHRAPLPVPLGAEARDHDRSQGSLDDRRNDGTRRSASSALSATFEGF